MGFMGKRNGLWQYLQVFTIFVIVLHLVILKTENTKLSSPETKHLYSQEKTSHKKCNKLDLADNNRTPIQCNSNYCSGFSLFFTASFHSFAFEKFMDQEISNRYFLYDDPPYSSFFNSIWIPPKITG
jgi:Na+/melibiose symporter-like transporter